MNDKIETGISLRTYQFDALRPGGFMTPPQGKFVTTKSRIRVVAVIMFRKWFGLEPTESWGSDGFMAQCWDKRGNKVWIEQINNTPETKLLCEFNPGSPFSPLTPV